MGETKLPDLPGDELLFSHRRRLAELLGCEPVGHAFVTAVEKMKENLERAMDGLEQATTGMDWAEVRRDDDGLVDEIVGVGSFHLEDLGDGWDLHLGDAHVRIVGTLVEVEMPEGAWPKGQAKKSQPTQPPPRPSLGSLFQPAIAPPAPASPTTPIDYATLRVGGTVWRSRMAYRCAGCSPETEAGCILATDLGCHGLPFNR